MAANGHDKEIVVELGGKHRILRFTLGSFRRLHRATGINPFKEEEMKPALSAPTPEFVQAFIWAGLVADDPELTADAVGDMLSLESLSQILQSAVRALNRDAQVKQGDPTQAPAPAA